MKCLTLVTLTTLLAMSSLATKTSAANLIGHWNFNEASGASVFDQVGSNDGTIIGTTATRIAGVEGNAVRINATGTNSYVTFGSLTSSIGTGDYTVSMWIKGFSGYSTHVRHGALYYEEDGAGPLSYRHGIEKNTGFYQFVNTVQRSHQNAPYSNYYDNGAAFHHFVLGREAGTEYYYFDNTGTNYAQAAVNLSAATAAHLGWNPDGRFMFAAYDEVQVYDEWIGADGVNTLFNNPGSTLAAVIPEPGAFALALLSLAGLGCVAWRRNRTHHS